MKLENPALKFIWTYTNVIVALFTIAIAINMFLGPHDVAAGGVSGLGILFDAAFGWNRALVILVLNAVMLVLALVFLGRNKFYKLLFGSIVFPMTIAIVPEMMVTTDRLLSVLFGSAIFAVGVVILYRNNSSSGGTTIPPLILKKYFNINPSLGLLVTDGVVVSLNLFIFGVEEFLYAILSVIITSMTMEYLETGMNRKKSIMIMSETEEKLEAIRIAIGKEVNRGVTLLNAKGGFSRREKEVLLIVTTDHEFFKIKKVVQEVDPKAFVLVNNVSEVLGSGFTFFPVEYL